MPSTTEERLAALERENATIKANQEALTRIPDPPMSPDARERMQADLARRARAEAAGTASNEADVAQRKRDAAAWAKLEADRSAHSEAVARELAEHQERQRVLSAEDARLSAENTRLELRCRAACEKASAAVLNSPEAVAERAAAVVAARERWAPSMIRRA